MGGCFSSLGDQVFLDSKHFETVTVTIYKKKEAFEECTERWNLDPADAGDEIAIKSQRQIWAIRDATDLAALKKTREHADSMIRELKLKALDTVALASSQPLPSAHTSRIYKSLAREFVLNERKNKFIEIKCRRVTNLLKKGQT